MTPAAVGMPTKFSALFAALCVFLLPTCSPLRAENAASPVTRINRVQALDPSGKVEFDSKLTFKDNADRVSLASELGIAGGVVGVTEIAGHSGVVTLGDLSLDHVGNATTGNGTFAIGNGSLTIDGAGQITATTTPTNIQTTDGTLNLSGFSAVSYSAPGSAAVTRSLIGTTGKFADLLPTPADYGATNDSTKHPVSEWIPSRYADITTVRTVFGSDVQTTDSIDWVVLRYLRQHFKSVALPPNPNALTVGNGYYLDHPLEAYDDGQQLIGHGRQGPYGSLNGTRIIVAPGIDGIRHSYRTCSVRDLSIEGSAVNIKGVTSTSGGQATMETTTAHGLSGTTFTITNTTGTTTYNNPAVSTTVTSSAAHGLTSGDFVEIYGSSETVLNGIWRVRVLTSTTFKVLTTDQGELGVSTAGAGGSFRRVYEVGAGPDYATGVQGATPPVVGIYHVTVTDSTHLKLYDEDNAAVILSVNATANTGTLYTSRHLIHFGSGDEFDNTQNSPDPGHSFFIENLFAHNAQCGFYTGISDASSGRSLVAYTCAVGLWDDGALDNLPFTGTWMTGCFTAGYRVSRGGAMTLTGGGGAYNKVFVDQTRESSTFVGVGNYFEVPMRSGPAPYSGAGTGDAYFEIASNSTAIVTGLIVQDGGVPDMCHFHTSVGAKLQVIGCAPGLHAWQKGSSQVYGDSASQLVVSYQGATSNDYSLGKYQASDALVMDWGNVLPSPTLAMVGRKIRIIPYGGKVTEPGLWICENFSGSPTGTPVWVRTSFDVLGATVGGTGQSSYTAGDLLYATSSTTLTKLAKGSDGQVLTIDNTTHLPVWATSAASITTYSISSTSNYNMSGTTLTNVSTLTIPAVAVGTYSVRIRGSVNFGGGGDAGWKWDLKGGTAVLGSHFPKYMNTTNIPQAGSGAQMYWMGNGDTWGPTGQGAAVDGNIYSGEDWTTVTGGGQGNFGFDYAGSLNVTTVGSIIFRQANHTTSGDTGTLGQCIITLTKQ